MTRNVLLTVLAVILVAVGVSFWVCYQTVKAETHVRYVGMMNVASEKIAKTIRGMEMNARNVFDEVEKHLDSPDHVIAALESKTSLNPDVNGYFAAFEPDYFKQKGRWFEPYVHQDDSSMFKVNQVGSARHDYTKSGWYIRAKESSQSFWSDPYYYQDNDEIGLSGHYCTFVKPVFDSTGRLACVCGADMTLEWLTKELKQIDHLSRADELLNRYSHSVESDFYTVVINHDGTCIAHPEGRQTVITDERVLSDMAQKKSGTANLSINGVTSTVYYGPIDFINWSVAVVVPRQDIWKPLLLPGIAIQTVALLGMLVIWLTMRKVKQ